MVLEAGEGCGEFAGAQHEARERSAAGDGLLYVRLRGVGKCADGNGMAGGTEFLLYGGFRKAGEGIESRDWRLPPFENR